MIENLSWSEFDFRFLNNAERITSYFYSIGISDEVIIACILGYCIIMVGTNDRKNFVLSCVLRSGNYFYNLPMTAFQEWENSNVASLVTYFLLQMTNVTTMFTSCYIGQLLIDEVYHWLLQIEFLRPWCSLRTFLLWQASIVKKVSNTLDWYRLPVKTARSLIMIIITSNCPIKVTAANIVDMSLATFTDVSTNSIVIHKNLHTVYEKDYFMFSFCHDKTDTLLKNILSSERNENLELGPSFC